MRTFLTALAIFAAAVAPAAAQEKPLSKDDVVRMLRAGVGEELILTKIELDKASFTLSAEDVALLKELKASDKLIQRMLGGKAPEAAAKPEPARAADGTKNVALKNVSHRAVKVSADEKEMLLNFSLSRGTDLPVGGSLELAVKAGDYRIAIEGRPTIEMVRVGEGAGATVTVRGADTEYIDVQTAVVEDAEGRRVVILHSEGKLTEGQRPRTPDPRPRVVTVRYLYGPAHSHLHYSGNAVLLGAGVGAIIGHQHGRLWKGALIGAAAGWLLEHSILR